MANFRKWIKVHFSDGDELLFFQSHYWRNIFRREHSLLRSPKFNNSDEIDNFIDDLIEILF
jgi:hypothetical protein